MISSATTQQGEPRRRASCPSIQASAWTPAPSQSLESCTHAYTTLSEDSSSPHVGQTVSTPDATIESPPFESTISAPDPWIKAPHEEIPLLGPVPEDFGLAYDYLGKVKELADEVGPDVWEDCFERHFVEGPTTILVVSRGTYYHLSFDDRPDTIFDKIRDLRQYFFDPHEPDPVVIVVEAINRTGIQVLGMALDVDPSFFSRHLRHRTRGTELSRQFESYINARSTSHGHGNVTDFHGASGLVDYGFLCTSRRMSAADSPTGKQPPIFAGANRMKTHNGFLHLSPQISCARGSKNSCIILVDAALPFNSGAGGPFDETNMIRLEIEHLPAHLDVEVTDDPTYSLLYAIEQILLSEQNGKFIFALNISTGLFVRLLASYMVLNVWRCNVEYIEQRLEHCRHQAIVHPSLITFQPLTTLRMNIADLEKAIMEAREAATEASRFWFSHCELDALEKDDNARPELPEVAYKSLLQRVGAMSSLLNNEIQLVIGSVTVQDSDIMKQQAKRATLLTILAVIYLPLTLVTGIFGMNLKQINDATPELWACGVGLVVVSGVTAAGFFGYWYWRKFHDARESGKRELEEKMYKIA